MRNIIISSFLTCLLAKKYLIEVADEGDEVEEGGEEGSDYSTNNNFEMKQDGKFYFYFKNCPFPLYLIFSYQTCQWVFEELEEEVEEEK